MRASAAAVRQQPRMFCSSVVYSTGKTLGGVIRAGLSLPGIDYDALQVDAEAGVF
jgi:hypothetical protein